MYVDKLDSVVGLGKVVQALMLVTCAGELSGSDLLLRVVLVFPSTKENVRMGLQIRPEPYPSSFFRIDCSIIILSFNVIVSSSDSIVK